MKVGIMSMQRILNYGSYLQATSLKQMIESLGGEVEFVDYKIEPVIYSDESKSERKKRITTYKLKRSRLNGFIRKNIRRKSPFVPRYKRIKVPETFIKPFEKLGVYPERNICPRLDLLVVGSDEVFNCLQTNPDVGYSLQLFGKNNKAKKLISYAASFGNTTIERLEQFKVKEEIAKYLRKFDEISVRDSNSGNVVKQLTGREPVYNLDPVLVGNFDDIVEDNVKIRDYIVLYGYANRFTEEEGKYISEYAEKRGKRLITLCAPQSFCSDNIECTPLEILAYFKHADCIITDTFHGAIFSVINHKKFVTVIRDSTNGEYGNREKLGDLIARLDLNDRIIEDMSALEEVMEKEIDYSAVDAFREKEREKTLSYLGKYVKQ